jgi:hypothetical protein
MPMPPRFAVNKSSGVKSPATTHTSSSSSSSESASGSGSSESTDSSGSESSSEGGSPKQKKLGLSPDKLLKKKVYINIQDNYKYLCNYQYCLDAESRNEIK